jgi:chemotaxis-related protein WspB
MLILTFTAGANRYAIDVMRVVEVVPKVELRKIPHAPLILAGFLGYRGKVVPVLDLGLLLGVAPCQEWLSTRIILVNDASGNRHHRDQSNDTSQDGDGARGSGKLDPDLLGLVAECVNDLTYIQSEQIIPAPVLLPQTPYLGAMIQTDQGIVQFIVVEQLRATPLRLPRPDQGATSDLNSELSSLIR